MSGCFLWYTFFIMSFLSRIYFIAGSFLRRRRMVFLYAFSVVLIVGGIALAYYAGITQGSAHPQTISVEGVIDPEKNDSVDFVQFWRVWNILKDNYVLPEKTEDNQKLLYGAISGLTQSLDDPYTTFFPPKDAQKFTEDISGEFGGIGAEIGLDEGRRVIVIAPLKNTPADRAGLRAQDVIVKVNDTFLAGMSAEDAAKIIRGPKGTTVKLVIYRDGWDSEKIFDITRDIIQLPTLEAMRVNFLGKEDSRGPITYIKLHNFYDKASSLFYQTAVKMALLGGSDGIILDLRNNPGGYLEVAVQISSWFVEKGHTVVTEAFRDVNKNQVFVSRGPGLFTKTPIVVLINKGSASASEILAGALKENNGAIVMGETSFGKGTVQELLDVGKGSLLKVTVAHWLTPNGTRIDQNGISPDIEIIAPESISNNPEKVDAYWIERAAQELSKKMK